MDACVAESKGGRGSRARAKSAGQRVDIFNLDSVVTFWEILRLQPFRLSQYETIVSTSMTKILIIRKGLSTSKGWIAGEESAMSAQRCGDASSKGWRGSYDYLHYSLDIGFGRV